MSVVTDLEKSLVKLNSTTYDSVDKLMKKVAKDNDISATELHHKFKSKHNMIPDDWIKTQMQEGNLHKWFKGSKSKDGKSGWVNVVTGGTCASDKPGEGTPKCVSSSKRASMTPAERKSAQRRKKDADPNQQSKSGAAKPTYVSTDPKKKMKKEEIELSEVSKKLALKADYMRKKREFDAAEDGDDKEMDKQLTKSGKFKSDENRRRILKKHGDGSKENLDKNTYKAHFEEVEITEAKDKKGKGSGTKDACYHKVKSRYSVWPSAYASGALVKCRKVGASNWGNSTKKEGFEGFYDLPEMTDLQINAMRRSGIEVEVLDEKCWKGYEKKGMKTMFGKRYPNCVKKEETEVTEGKYSSGSVTYVKGTAPVRATYGGRTETFPKETYKKKGMVKTAEEAEVRYCPKCKKNETREECAYGGNYWDENSMPAKGTEEVSEAVRIPAKTGNIVMVNLGWKGKYYSIKMFFPQISKPSRKDVQDQIEKIYPGGKLYTFVVSNYEPGEPMFHSEGAAWTKKSGKNKEGGLNEKGRKSYEKENPGSDLKAPSKKVGNPRRASFCARMKGMKKKLTSKKTASDPDSRINKSLRAWNC